ncbi:putative G-type lectin S-receptor-like serine/threonine-protein kinase, partial [Mucuna pruriens]
MPRILNLLQNSKPKLERKGVKLSLVYFILYFSFSNVPQCKPPSCRLEFPYLKYVIMLKLEKLLALMCLWLWWSTCIHVLAANDSLKPGDTLNYTSILFSKNHKYYLQFIPQVDDKRYLAIFSLNDADTVPWVGNRNQPFEDSAVLSLNHSGVLKIESQSGKPIILYSPPQPQAINNTVATLLDTGNFVLQQLHPNGTKSLLWQSFDYPLDTLISTMKLGVNHKTGHQWLLVSPSADSLAPGAFSLEWEPMGQELIIRRRGIVCWRSGKLRNDRFEHISEDAQRMLKYTVVSNGDEDSFSFTTTSEGFRWSITNIGRLYYNNETDAVKADMCYGYNTDGGCQRWEDIPKCRNRGDVFQKKTVIARPVAGAIVYLNGTGCIFFQWKSAEEVTFNSIGEDFYMLVNITPHNGTKRWIWISAIIAATLLIICLSILCLALKKRKYVVQEKKGKEMAMKMPHSTCKSSSAIEDLENDLKKGHDLKVFNYTLVMTATNGFSSENKLGQGGFGPVYKGILPEGQEVAVKRLSKSSGQGIVEFKNELTLICELQHMNLVQLLGCCIHEEERILIYEYMPNKSLDFYLFDCSKSKLLDWKKRFSIIEGIAQGVLYLHKYSRLKVIHRDLKASNILLDENMNPKISDFGMARMFTQESISNTNRIVGTYGYMSPEYAMEGIFSTKSDVYSFGILLLEIVSGRKNTSFYDVDRPLNLIGHVWELWKDGICLELVDPSLNGLFDLEEVQRCIHIGLLCVEHYANDRPTMYDIISMLTNKSAIVSLPRRPAFYVRREILDENLSSTELCTSSTVEITTSLEIE